MLALLSQKRRHSRPRGSPQPGPSHFRNKLRPSGGPYNSSSIPWSCPRRGCQTAASRAAQVSLIFVKPSEPKIFAAALGSQVLLPAIFSPSLSASVERDRDVLSKARTVPKVLTCFLLTGKKKTPRMTTLSCTTQEWLQLGNTGPGALQARHSPTHLRALSQCHQPPLHTGGWLPTLTPLRIHRERKEWACNR